MILLKTLEQVEISETFIQLVRRFFNEKIAAIEQHNAYWRGERQEESKLLRYYQTENGWQVFLTRLKQLSYKRFEGIRSKGMTYLKATTKDLSVHMPGTCRHDFNQYLPEGNYSPGEYAIYLPYQDLLANVIENIHFLPTKALTLDADRDFQARHLHHYARFYEGESVRTNPLTYIPRTCWGSFGSIVTLTLNAGDIPELFRALHLFLTIQNPDSPLVAPQDLTHIYERIT